MLPRWLRHPIEAFRYWQHGYGEADWRTRLLRPFLQPPAPQGVEMLRGELLEQWDYRWIQREMWYRYEQDGWKWVDYHPMYEQSGLVKRRVK